MTSVSGFWSYAHSDNEDDDGRILRLAKSIQKEYRVQTGEVLDVFTDNSGILWGQEWKKRLDDELIETTFFIPIVTQSYLRSRACREEILTFSRKARSLGVEEFILPILYAFPKAFEDNVSNDDVVNLIKGVQWRDWRKHRLLDESSAEHRQAVSALVERIVSIVEAAPTVPLPPIATVNPGEGEDSPPGMLDILGKGESAMPEWQQGLVEIGTLVGVIQAMTNTAVKDLAKSDQDGGGASGRLRVIREYSLALTPYAEQIDKLGSSFATNAVEVDASVSTLLQLISDGNYQKSEKPEIENFFVILEGVADLSRGAIDALTLYVATLNDLPGLSRDLRKPSIQIQHGIQLVVDGLSVIEKWLSQISGIRNSSKWSEE